MSEEGRLAMSGPEVIETTHGVEEYDARDRALVWRTSGGKHRYLLGDCDALLPDSIDAFADAAIAAIERLHAGTVALTQEELEAEQRMLKQRLEAYGKESEPSDIWRAMGIADPAALPMLEADAFVSAVAPHRRRAA
jgi:malonate decarboxylase beta subunit